MKTILLLLITFMWLTGYSQIINEQFSSVAPSATIWTSTSSSWVLNHNYGAGNAYSGSYCARLSSASSGNGKYLYIKISVTSGNDYTLSFWSKRFCNTTVNTNETADQTSLLYSTTYNNTGCNNTWYNSSITYTATYTGDMYWQILCNTVYGGPTSIYLDDITISEATPLPIELMYFKSSYMGNYNKLYWSTASEHNNDYFTIEKSYNGYDFKEVAKIDGVGYSQIMRYYEYHDGDIISDIVYYRLKQTDYDGRYDYSDIISLDNRKNINIVLIRRVNLMGLDVDYDYNGIILNIYSDGSVIKVNNYH